MTSSCGDPLWFRHEGKIWGVYCEFMVRARYGLLIVSISQIYCNMVSVRHHSANVWLTLNLMILTSIKLQNNKMILTYNIKVQEFCKLSSMALCIIVVQLVVYGKYFYIPMWIISINDKIFNIKLIMDILHMGKLNKVLNLQSQRTISNVNYLNKCFKLWDANPSK